MSLRLAARVTVVIGAIVSLPAAMLAQPPAPPAVGLARAALRAPGVQWDSIALPGAVVYAERGTANAAVLPALAARVTRARRRSLALLGAPASSAVGASPPLRVFYTGSRERVRAIAGVPATGFTDAPARAVLAVAGPTWAPLETHEVMHALSLTRWGDPRRGAAWGTRGEWLVEGLAAAAEDRCGSWTGRQVVAALARTRPGLLPVDTLVTSFRRQDDLLAYLQAGTLVQYLLEQRGPSSLRRVWTSGPAAFPAAYGQPWAALVAGWRRWLDETPRATPAPDLPLLRREGCGHAPDGWRGARAREPKA